MKTNSIVLLLVLFCINCSGDKPIEEDGKIQFPEIKQVEINDPFWSPKLELWGTITANDVLDKFEGKHEENQEEHNAFCNFDHVVEGKQVTAKHVGPPWYDGLVYETIRGISDLLIQYPDKKLEQRLDQIIDKIAAAQESDPDGYVNTYTQLVEPDHRWGWNGGFLRWQHDVYNAGMLVEAGIHYYKATGKTKLLTVATRFANYMSDYMGPAPKKNIIPSHSGPEEAVVKLYWLYKNNPKLKSEISVPVNENAYFELVQYWIENRGVHCGYPLWLAWGNEKSEQWIKDQKYTDPEFGDHSRPTWGDYAQDSISVFEQKTIEGHAVRATLLATGIATVAIENNSQRYIDAANNLWNNMVGKRMFITGGVGAIHYDEKFGQDYFLPVDAYLETCAAVGAGFFSQRMNELTGDGIYMDELERSLYNNILTGISLSGTLYTYQNPLNTENHTRWSWHGCPCCPPMFLKIVSEIPHYIYSYKPNEVYVNLFISSEAELQLTQNRNIKIKQETRYPWEGNISITIYPEKEDEFTVNIRIPGWAQGKENPFGLYHSDLNPHYTLKVNGTDFKPSVKNGYAEVNRVWKKGDKIDLSLPMEPRIIEANQQVTNLTNHVSIASGPLVYCFENIDNEMLQQIKLDIHSPFELTYQKDLLNGVNIIQGKARINEKEEVTVRAIPFYAAGNRQRGGSYKVWINK